MRNGIVFFRTNLLNRFAFQREKSTSSAEYCFELVKKNDYDNFVCTLLLKNPSRSNAIAIRSFNIEVAKICENVTQKETALMRFKFWNDVLEKCFMQNINNDAKQIPRHPVAMELFKVLNRSKLTKRYFKNLILSREDVSNKKLIIFDTLEDMENYCEKTVSSVLYLILEGCGVKNIHADHAASHLGKAQGIVQQLRAVPLSRNLNFISLPQDVLIKNRITEEEILRFKSSENLKNSIYEIATLANQHLTKSRNLQEKIPKEAKRVLLPAVSVKTYLDKLEKLNFDIFHANLTKRSSLMLPKLFYYNFKNRY